MTEYGDFAAKTIVCYGDSNTWGYIPGLEKRRYPPEIRWPCVMARLLGDGYRVVEEGLSGRTTVRDDPIEGGETVDKNGINTLGAILDTHSPIDLVIIMLGTNDLKRRFNLPAFEVALGVELLIKTTRNPAFGPGRSSVPEILVVCPPPILEIPETHGAVFEGGAARSLDLEREFGKMCQRQAVPVLYAAHYIESDSNDGIHFAPESHALLAEKLAAWVKGNLPASS